MSQDEVSEEFTAAIARPGVIVATYGWMHWLRVNPALTKVHSTQLSHRIELTIRLTTSEEAGGLQSADEYVTDPPCQHITLQRQEWEKDEWFVIAGAPAVCCSVYCKTGVKISDLLEVRDQIEEQQREMRETSSEIVATLLVLKKEPATKTVEDERIQQTYFAGPLPRYRKATHLLDRKGVAIYRKDEDTEWDPNMDAVSSEQGAAAGSDRDDDRV